MYYKCQVQNVVVCSSKSPCRGSLDPSVPKLRGSGTIKRQNLLTLKWASASAPNKIQGT